MIWLRQKRVYWETTGCSAAGCSLVGSASLRTASAWLKSPVCMKLS